MNNSLNTKLSILPKKLLRIRMSRIFAMNLFTFFFNDTATTDIYTLSRHDALPIYHAAPRVDGRATLVRSDRPDGLVGSGTIDRKSTRLNSSHVKISYAVFCLK